MASSRFVRPIGHRALTCAAKSVLAVIIGTIVSQPDAQAQVQAQVQAQAGQVTDSVAPEIASAVAAKGDGNPVKSKNWMVVVANPLAAKAAADVLRSGGSAADATVAAQAMLGLVEPQSSGLGGGAFVVHYNAASGTITTLDGRETAPLAATPKLFQKTNGEPMGFFDAVIGGRSVGTPGTPALMAKMHGKWGRTDWASLLQPAIDTAQAGFSVSPRLATLVQSDAARLSVDAVTAAYFLPGGTPVKTGDLLKNPDYARTLTQLQSGTGDFYSGTTAQNIVDAVRRSTTNPGLLSLDDLAAYTVKERDAVCAPYRGHQVCGMGPPSSGALTVGQILRLVEPFDLAALGAKSAESWRVIGDASRLAFADRGRYMADSDFVKMPTKGLLDTAYLAERANLLERAKALETVTPGEPPHDRASLDWADDASLELPSTSHISIVDGAGNAISMTTTIENGFGSRVMVGGFLLNNELTDFSFRDVRDGKPVANRVEPGKRPRSSMAPTIVRKDGRPVLVVGSPGGSRIIGYVAKTIIAHLDWGMNVQEAVASPHLVNRFGTFDLENNPALDPLASELTALGFKTNRRGLTSGLHVIALTPQGLEGGADPRREGIAIGE
ncbi:MAG: gamma-glutamyltransferase [Pseudomonadota bacterium]